MKYYVDEQGNYLGGWSDNPPSGAIEVPSAPDDARRVWDGDKWDGFRLTFQEALKSVNLAYQSDVDKFNKAFMTAYLADGPEQETKQATIRAQYVARKAQYAADVQTLRSQFESGV